MKFYKKGQTATGMSWNMITGLILVAIVTVIFIQYGNAIGSIFLSDDMDSSTMAGYTALTADPDITRAFPGGAVVRLLNSRDTIDSTTEMVSAWDKKVIIAFDTGWDVTKEQSMNENFIVAKPSECRDKACICVYTDKLSEKNRNENVYACKLFSGNIKFGSLVRNIDKKRSCGTPRTDFESDLSGTFSYSHTFLYGTSKDCKDWETTKVYVEKFVKNPNQADETTYILITPWREEATIRETEVESKKIASQKLAGTYVPPTGTGSQTGTSGMINSPHSCAGVDPTCPYSEADEKAYIETYMKKYSKSFGVDLDLVKAHAEKESWMHHCSGGQMKLGLNKNSAGDVVSVDFGVMQLNDQYYTCSRDIEHNIKTGIKKLYEDDAHWKSEGYIIHEHLTSASYNCGVGGIGDAIKADGRAPADLKWDAKLKGHIKDRCTHTQDYVDNVQIAQAKFQTDPTCFSSLAECGIA